MFAKPKNMGRGGTVRNPTYHVKPDNGPRRARSLPGKGLARYACSPLRSVEKYNVSPGFTTALNVAKPIPLPAERVCIDWESKLTTEVTRNPKNHLWGRGNTGRMAEMDKYFNQGVGAAGICFGLCACQLRKISSNSPFPAKCANI